MKYDKPLVLPIKKIITDSPRVKSFVFDFDFPGEPGQFVMCWIPGFDEKPFGLVKKVSEGGFRIAVAAVGEATQALHAMQEGDLLGFRGPYGSTFSLPNKGKIALVGGGYGMAPLSFLAQEAVKKDIEVHLYIGARNQEELLYASWMEEIGVKMHPSTDDGSAGYKGYNTDLFAQEIDSLRPDKVYTVGPEIMEMKIAKVCYEKKIPFEVSLERFMKCGFGVCGQCSVDPTGWRMCVEGPVLTGEELAQVSEFGSHHRTASGHVITK